MVCLPRNGASCYRVRSVFPAFGTTVRQAIVTVLEWDPLSGCRDLRGGTQKCDMFAAAGIMPVVRLSEEEKHHGLRSSILGEGLGG